MTPLKETQRQFFSVFGLILASALFISLFSNVGVFIEDELFAGGRFDAAAMIGPIPVGQLSRKEATGKIDQSITQWKRKAKIFIEFRGQDITLNSSIFAFDKDKSVSQAKENGPSPLLVTLKEKDLQDQIESSLTSAPDSIEWDKLQKDVIAKVSTLSPLIRINLEGFAKLSSQEIVAEADLSLPFDMPVLQEWIKEIGEVEIKAGDKFSLLSLMDERKLNPAESNDLQFLASSIYSASLKTNFTILERHISQTKPVFIPLGYEANVIPGKWDLVLENPDKTTYTLDFLYQPKKIKVLIKGVPFKDKYSLVLADQKEYAPRTIIQWNSTLAPGQQVEKEVGQSGQSLKVYRVVKGPSGATQKDLIAEDFYFPMFRIIEENPSSAVTQSGNGSSGNLPSAGEIMTPQAPIDTSSGTGGKQNTQKQPDENEVNGKQGQSKQPSVPIHVIGKPI